jgi:EAL domain-containing protein (putative c-di-GMP-specific phosphodiesterase class I)
LTNHCHDDATVTGQVPADSPATLGSTDRTDNTHLPRQKWLCGLSVFDVVAEPSLLIIHLQPIVDLLQGEIVGYEALSRFPSCSSISYEELFRAADHSGMSSALEATAVLNARKKIMELPSSNFLSINVTPKALLSSQVRESLDGDLTRIAIELTGQIPEDLLPDVASALTELRSHGAIVALDDTGVDYKGLKTLEALKPEIVKLTRSLVSGIDKDPIKVALVKMVSEVVDDIGGWVLAVGIETQAEITQLIDLNVPLGQGWALGKPKDELAPMSSDLSNYISSTSRSLYNSTNHISLRNIAKRASLSPSLHPTEDIDSSARYVVTVDEEGQPHSLHRRTKDNRWEQFPVSALISPDEESHQVAKRLLQRNEETRLDPALCLGPTGEWDCVIEIPDLFAEIARRLEEIAEKQRHLRH